MKGRRLAGAVAAFVFAIVGTFVLVSYVQTAEDRALAGEELVEVLVVKEGIGAGSVADDIGGKVAVERVPAKVRADGALDSLDTVTGKVASVALEPGEQLLETRFVDAKSFRTARFEVPDDLLEVTVALDPERAIGGSLIPGDTVAVIASFSPEQRADTTGLVLHKVLVTQVQVEKGAGGLSRDDKDEGSALGQTNAPAGRLLVTLAIDVRSVERVVFAAEHGSLWLAAESAAAPNTPGTIQSLDTVYG